jgi:hypothetical protein
MVSEEPSPDCVNFAALLDFLEETPNKLATLTDGLLLAELCLKFSETEFSALENVCHLRDLELQGYTTRINRMLDETDPGLADFDGARELLKATTTINARISPCKRFRLRA